MTSKPCLFIQEKMATGDLISLAETQHIQGCSVCSRFEKENNFVNQGFKSMASMTLHHQVPHNFAYAVMVKIDLAERNLETQRGDLREIQRRSEPRVRATLSSFQDSIAALIRRPASQWAMMATGCLFLFSNLMRFVFFVVTPAGW